MFDYPNNLIARKSSAEVFLSEPEKTIACRMITMRLRYLRTRYRKTLADYKEKCRQGVSGNENEEVVGYFSAILTGDRLRSALVASNGIPAAFLLSFLRTVPGQLVNLPVPRV